jgi:catalase
MANFNRERIPERQPHAKGSGAFGHFQVTKDVSDYTKAALFQPGTKTDVLARFSTVAGERGSPDTWRDVRGFALKFYTSEGNYDMVGNNTPVFFLRDPMKFQHFIRSQKRRAENGLRDNDMQWDFWTLSPESAHQVTILFGDRGVPKSWRNMNGYSSHTYMWVNAENERFWVKYHFKTDQGIENLTQEEANRIAGEDADYHRRDLFEAIKRGDYPSWTLKVQIMPFKEAETYRFNPFDLTKVWPHGDYPLHEVGRLTLNRNPTDFHTEIEQAAFAPSNLVPGIGPSPDKMLLARLFSYPDEHRARLGVNFMQIPVNRPKSPVHSYSKDGAMRVDNVSDPVYAPNSKGGPTADGKRYPEVEVWKASGEFVRAAYTLRKDDDDWGQAGTLVREVMDDAARDRLVSNVVGALKSGVSEPVLERAFEYWRNIDKEIGDRIAKGVTSS